MLKLNLQIFSHSFVPKKIWFKKWAMLALPKKHPIELTIRIVNRKASQVLNQKYRGKNYPTNILSFTADGTPNYLGDLVICAPLVSQEARHQAKPLMHHWTHLTIHGVLHLLGYDHHTKTAAQTMETKEIKLLKKLNIENPY